MSKFSRNRRFYREPERYTNDIARERRYVSTLERERADIAALSPARREFITRWKHDEDPVKMGPKAASIAAAVSKFNESDFANPEKRAAYRKLRAAEEGLRKVTPVGADRRQFNPSGKDFASTIYGTQAGIGRRVATGAFSSWLPGFLKVGDVLPCIERIVRREVMFARGKGGRGYRVPHRRSWSSGVPC